MILYFSNSDQIRTLFRIILNHCIIQWNTRIALYIATHFGAALTLPGETAELLMTLGKGKAIQLQAWTGPESSRMLRFADFKTIST